MNRPRRTEGRTEKYFFVTVRMSREEVVSGYLVSGSYSLTLCRMCPDI